MSKPFLVFAAFLVWVVASTFWYDCNIKRVCDATVKSNSSSGTTRSATSVVTPPVVLPPTPTPTPSSATSSATAPAVAQFPAPFPTPTSTPTVAAVPSPAVSPATTQGPGPLSFMWADPGPIMSSAFLDYKRGEVAKMGATDQLEIIGLYSAAEQITAGNPTPNLGLARAEKTAALFADTITKDRVKLSAKIISDDAATEATKRAGFFASIDLRRVSATTEPAKAITTSVATNSSAPVAAVTPKVTPPTPTPVAISAPVPAPPVPPVPITKSVTTPSTSPAPVVAAAAMGDLKVVPIRFRIRTTTRGDDAEISAYLKKVAARVKAGARATITGFTDARGNPDSNRKLAETRAESIRAELVSLGSPADRMDITSKGGDSPTADNDTIEGRHNNRRVEITLK